MVTELQRQIMETLNVKPSIDPETELRARIDFAKEYLLKTGARGYVLGISGGLDSCISGYILQKSVEEARAETGNDEYKFIAMLLPYGVQGDAEDAKTVAAFIGADRVIELNIKPMVDAFEATYNASVNGGKLSDFAKGNAKARARCTSQYAVASDFGLLVGGSDNANEALTGFFTKSGGDGSFDLCPISGLTKIQETQILELVGAPSVILTKKPTADLLDAKPQQADEDELGLTYTQTSAFLTGEDIGEEATQIIEKRYLQTEHKRQLPVTPFDAWWKEPAAVV